MDMVGLCAKRLFVILRTTPKQLRELQTTMIRCHLSSLMGRDKLNITDVARATGLNRSTITALYRETATRVELPAIEQLCTLFKCSVDELLEHVPDTTQGTP